MNRKRILITFGTRPEAIKMAPVVRALLQKPDLFEVIVVLTAQHREMLDQVIKTFQIRVDEDLNIMTYNQPLSDLTAGILTRLDEVYEKTKPDLVLVHGDTTTTFCGALAAFYQRIPVGHVEAGLRTHDRDNPFPEEMNRVFADYLCHYHFAPTERAASNLKAAGISPAGIYVTGNTVIDALLYITGLSLDEGLYPEAAQIIQTQKPYVLITFHRRESFGEPQMRVFNAFKSLAAKYPDLLFIYPVHLNPNVEDNAYRILTPISNMRLIKPQDYISFVHLMKHCRFIISDSGGIQEEAPALGKPVLVLRSVSERPEAISSGVALLVGTNEEKIVSEASRLIEDDSYYHAISKRKNPFGDGTAARQIAELLAR